VSDSAGIIHSKRGLSFAAYVILLLCWVLIGWVMWKGAAGNPLHAEALSWAFWLQLVILAAKAASPLSELAQFVAAIWRR